MAKDLKQMSRWLNVLLLAVLSFSCSSEDEKTTPEPFGDSKARVVIRIPGAEMPAMMTRSLSPQLRAVAEVYPQGRVECLRHDVYTLTPSAQLGVYYFQIDDLAAADYDIYVWADYSTDGGDLYYNTTSLRGIMSLPHVASAVDANNRYAFFGKTTLGLTEGEMTHSQPVSAKSPFTHYRIVAMDVDTYNQMRITNGWPAIEDCEVRVNYRDYIPTSFDIVSGAPNDASQGVTVNSKPSVLDDGQVVVYDDFVFASGTGTSVSVKVEIINPLNQEVINSMDVKVDCQPGYVTTVSGDVLTGDIGMGSSITTDTRWEGEFNVEF